jgi:hypothetical protein
MPQNRTTQISGLRRAIDCLPERTRYAMLAGIDNNTIVVGAYTMGDGVCPMLAAHRAGGRTNFVAFARSWDEYCFRGVRKRRRRPRLATPTELATLRAHIEGSLLAEEHVDLRGAMAEHRDLVATRQAAEPEVTTEVTAPEPAVATVSSRPAKVRPGDPDRSGELKHRHGWRWMRIMRSYDEYEQALAAMEAAEDAQSDERELAHSD